MKFRHVLLFAAYACVSALLAGAWSRVGLDFHRGDHEAPGYWNTFLKYRPSAQLRFVRPIFELEPDRWNEFDEQRRADYLRWCRIRTGENEAGACTRHINRIEYDE